MAGSSRELQFMRLWEIGTHGYEPPVTQHKFHPTRKWALDFAFPSCKLGIEIQGGTFSRGKSGHTSGVGVQRDNEKSNAAILLGWRILKYTSVDLEKRPMQMLDEILEALNGKAAD